LIDRNNSRGIRSLMAGRLECQTKKSKQNAKMV